MCPPPETTGQSGGVNIPGTVGSVGGDIVGGDKITIYGTVYGYKRPTPSEQAPVNYVDRPELTGSLLAHLLSEGPIPKGRAMISALHGLGGIGKTTIARWLVWLPEVESRFADGRLWVTLGNGTAERADRHQ